MMNVCVCVLKGLLFFTSHPGSQGYFRMTRLYWTFASFTANPKSHPSEILKKCVATHDQKIWIVTTSCKEFAWMGILDNKIMLYRHYQKLSCWAYFWKLLIHWGVVNWYLTWDPRANPLISNLGACPGISGAVFGGKVIWEKKWDVRTGTSC
jgi:hypothetical protein